MAIKTIDDSERITINDNWENLRGEVVEDYICREIKTLHDNEIIGGTYSNQELILNKADGSLLDPIKITVENPTYSYGMKLVGIVINNNFDSIYTEANSNLVTQYNPDKSIKLGIALCAIASTSYSVTDRIGPFNVKIKFGQKTKQYKVSNVKYDDCIFDSSQNIIGVKDGVEIAWIEINELFSESNTGKISAELIEKDQFGDFVDAKDTLNLNITSEVISLSFSGTIITNSTIAPFALRGGSSSNYKLVGFNNGVSFANSNGALNYNSLAPGLNQLVVKAENINDPEIYTEYVYVDIICTNNCNETVVAVNGVSNGIANNGVSTLYQLNVYSPRLESTEITTYLEENEIDVDSEMPTEIMKYEILNPASYNDNGEYSTSYSKYIEINSNNSQRYLLININGEWYTFWTAYKSQATGVTNCYPANSKTMVIDAVNEKFTYFKDIQPSLSFDQIGGYLNDIFITDDYATAGTPATVISNLDAADGWKEESGRTIFKISAQDTPILKQPINLNLTPKFTLEFGFKIYNISDESRPILTIGDFQLRPTKFCWNTSSTESFLKRNSEFQENVETHILVTVEKDFTIKQSDSYYPDFLADSQTAFNNIIGQTKFNLARIYVNGVIDREIALSDAELQQLQQAKLQINPTTADIDFYLLRIYNNAALDFDAVQRNYLSFLKNKADKEAFYDKNDIVGANGEISFNKCREKYNTLVYVYPSGAKFPNRFWGGADGAAENTAQYSANKNAFTTLFVNYADPTINANYGGRLTKGQTKGQGSSAMRYLIWNVSYALGKHKEKTTDPETGKKIENKIKSQFVKYQYLDPETNRFTEDKQILENQYIMPPYDGQEDNTAYKAKKLVGKVNFASSMQSHKAGACKLYDDAFKAANGSRLPSGGLKAVHEEPFLYFYWETDLSNTEVCEVELADLIANNNDIKFMGFQTWGPGKGDDATFGHSDDTTEYLLIEGGENAAPSANFQIPWHALQRGTGTLGTNEYRLGSVPTISYEDSLEAPWDKIYIDDESIVYKWADGPGSGELDLDYGFLENENELTKYKYFTIDPKVYNSLKAFRAFFDFVYTHDYNLQINTESTTANWNRKYKYVSTNNNLIINGVRNVKGNVYRYDQISDQWVDAGVAFDINENKWQPLNIYTLTGVNSSLNVSAAIAEMKNIFKTRIGQYVDVQDVAFHQALVKFLSGTDNRAKNTYFQIIGKPGNDRDDYKIRLMGDDLDTILVTDNNGLQSKPYNLLESSYRPEDAEHWGDIGNAFFYMFDQCFEADIKSQLAKIIQKSFSNEANVNNKSNYFYKVFFGVQDYFPAVAYNHTAKIYYENAQLIYNSNVFGDYKNNKIQPIEQSHGSCIECEKQFMSKRLPFLASYAKQSMGGIGINTASSAGAGATLTLKMKFEPYQDFYPVYQYVNGTDKYLMPSVANEFDAIGYLVREGQQYEVLINEQTEATDQGIYFSNLYKKLDIVGLKRDTFDASLNRVTDFKIDNDDLKNYSEFNNYPELSISTFAPSFAVLENLTLRNMNVPNEIDLSKFLKLRTIDFTGTNVKSVILPQTGRLQKVILPETIESLKLYEASGLTELYFGSENDSTLPVNLKTLYIDCAKLNTRFNINLFCEQLVNCNSLESVTIRNANLRLTEDALMKLLLVQNVDLQGTITIVTAPDGTANKEISFDTKRQLVNLFGNISKDGNKLKVNYKEAQIINIAAAENVSVFRQAGQETGDVFVTNPFNLQIEQGNNVNIVDGENPFNPEVNSYLDITYTSNVPANTAVINQKTGDVTLKTLTPPDTEYTVTITVKTSSGNKTATSNIKFKWQAPKLGDFAWADGTFTSTYTNNKTLIGLVYSVVKANDENTAGTAYIIGKEYAFDPCYSGYPQTDRNSTSSNDTIKKLTDVEETLTQLGFASQNNSGYGVVTGVTSKEDVDMPDEITISTYTNSFATADNVRFKGKADTLLYVDHVNALLNPLYTRYSDLRPYISTVNGYSISNLDNLNSLISVIKTINNQAGEIMSCILYPYFYAMYLYQPKCKEGEQLHSAYTQGNWYAPSGSELSRVLYYRGYSANTSFNNADSIRNNIVNSIHVGNTTLTVPIFSLALKNAGNKMPVVWSNLAAADVNNITTTVYNAKTTNYKYYRFSNYGESVTNVWSIGTAPSTYGWEASGETTNAWRLTKHQGIPFTQFNYSKP